MQSLVDSGGVVQDALGQDGCLSKGGVPPDVAKGALSQDDRFYGQYASRCGTCWKSKGLAATIPIMSHNCFLVILTSLVTVCWPHAGPPRVPRRVGHRFPLSPFSPLRIYILYPLLLSPQLSAPLCDTEVSLSSTYCLPTYAYCVPRREFHLGEYDFSCLLRCATLR